MNQNVDTVGPFSTILLHDTLPHPPLHPNMDTRTIQLHFSSQKVPNWDRTATIPASLLNRTASASREWQELYHDTMRGITILHQAECNEKRDSDCCECDSPSTTTLLCPASYLHLADDPMVYITVVPVCGELACERAARVHMAAMWRTHDTPDASRMYACVVCGQTDKLMNCASCKVTMYCGKEHQRTDWKAHKRMCHAATS
ncbi:hypothetical protein BKA63DRAFT_41061 [Paraphoma chrysanthemicola]|nr:hypothetical protein BKA63DRAFT_41061 [Paraphoma chrysanthemicola]